MTLADQAAMTGQDGQVTGKQPGRPAAGAEDGIRAPEMALMEKIGAFALSEPDVRVRRPAMMDR
jgi:hypothetical protein